MQRHTRMYDSWRRTGCEKLEEENHTWNETIIWENHITPRQKSWHLISSFAFLFLPFTSFTLVKKHKHSDWKSKEKVHAMRELDAKHFKHKKKLLVFFWLQFYVFFRKQPNKQTAEKEDEHQIATFMLNYIYRRKKNKEKKECVLDFL